MPRKMGAKKTAKKAVRRTTTRHMVKKPGSIKVDRKRIPVRKGDLVMVVPKGKKKGGNRMPPKPPKKPAKPGKPGPKKPANPYVNKGLSHDVILRGGKTKIRQNPHELYIDQPHGGSRVFARKVGKKPRKLVL